MWPGEVDAGIRHQLGLEFCQINIQGSRTSLVVQWLRLGPSTAGGMSLFPNQGIKILQCNMAKINKNKKTLKHSGFHQTLGKQLWRTKLDLSICSG